MQYFCRSTRAQDVFLGTIYDLRAFQFFWGLKRPTTVHACERRWYDRCIRHIPYGHSRKADRSPLRGDKLWGSITSHWLTLSSPDSLSLSAFSPFTCLAYFRKVGLVALLFSHIVPTWASASHWKPLCRRSTHSKSDIQSGEIYGASPKWNGYLYNIELSLENSQMRMNLHGLQHLRWKDSTVPFHNTF